MNEQLLPCPFCGGKASIERYGDRRQSTQYSCNDCACFLETGEEWNHGERWNTRPTPWVSVKDELPPKNKSVLVFTGLNQIVAFLTIYLGNELWYEFNGIGSRRIEKPLFWMPLPAEPK